MIYSTVQTAENVEAEGVSGGFVKTSYPTIPPKSPPKSPTPSVIKIKKIRGLN
jgi:hypothetical protein